MNPIYANRGMALTSLGFTTVAPGGSAGDQAAVGRITIKGDRPAIPNGSGNYDTKTGAWSATIIGPDRIAGFQQVEVKWVNMQFTGTGNNTVTGTYQVGTNGNLNNEPSPITYKVTGTVTRK